MSGGFYQLTREGVSQYYTAFSTPFGSIKWLRMPMGLNGSPNTFQSRMEKVLIGLTWKFTIPFLDDCIFLFRTIGEHLERLREIFQRFEDASLKINPTKCEFFRQKVPFCMPWRQPSRSWENFNCQQVPGTKERYRSEKFHRPPFNLQKIWTRLCRNRPSSASIDRENNYFFWNSDVREAFEILKARRTSTPVLALLSMRERFIFYIDTSQHAISAVLVQDQNGSERVIYYASKCFSKSQSLYSTTKRELLAIANFTRHFKHYVLGTRFQIVSDHRAFQWLHIFKDPDGLTARWLEKLAVFEYESVHGSGKSIGQPDSMSRIPSQDDTTDQANAPTHGVEAKHPTQNNDEASDTEWPNRPRTGEGKTSHLTEEANETKTAATTSVYARCWTREKSTKFWLLAYSLPNRELKENRINRVEWRSVWFHSFNSTKYSIRFQACSRYCQPC